MSELICRRPGCGIAFQPRAHNQRYCSLRCKRWMSNHSPRHLAAKLRHDERRRESGLKAEQDQHWYYRRGGDYKQYKARLRRRLAERLLDLELRRQEARTASDGVPDERGLVWK